jgi:prepilin-type processing-associated H-X9-DG protein
VELLVVITIIGILVAMMAPGVMAMRESSRRMTCLHNLHQIGAALNEYTTAYGVLPPGTIDRQGPIHNTPSGNHMGWLARLLPYLDEKTVFDHVDFAAGAYTKKNAAARSIRIPIFVCPSDPRETPQPEIAASNYAGCHNDVEKPIDANDNGVLFLNSSISPDDVTDGVSHTIFVGEKVVESGDLGWLSGTRATLRNTGTPPQAGSGAMALPVPKNDLYVGGFSSCHGGVCNFLFGDGRTDSITNSIDTTIFQQLGNRADGKLLKHGPTRDD